VLDLLLVTRQELLHPLRDEHLALRSLARTKLVSLERHVLNSHLQNVQFGISFMKISRQLVAFFGKEAIPVVLELGVVDVVEARVVLIHLKVHSVYTL
jgi:hypothetical protein